MINRLGSIIYASMITNSIGDVSHTPDFPNQWKGYKNKMLLYFSLLTMPFCLSRTNLRNVVDDIYFYDHKFYYHRNTSCVFVFSNFFFTDAIKLVLHFVTELVRSQLWKKHILLFTYYYFFIPYVLYRILIKKATILNSTGLQKNSIFENYSSVLEDYKF